ncbi:Autotransporter beta-domain protein [Novipirellula galeiformis]|uniref:Autotransporter beta-domain protein n=2 Tax=Novipirellula galeiformis TaxID=2528004 RepID=A0A5C6BSQ2_9BACT|nr:Autotransporter beta-domain protein [Novipirellula galeiformis]
MDRGKPRNMKRISMSLLMRFYKRRVLSALLAVSMLAHHASATDVTVTNTADSGAGSLRAAIGNAAEGDRIVFDIPGASPSTIILLSNLPTIASGVTFDNPVASPITLDRNGFGPLRYAASSMIDPGTLVLETSGAPSVDTDLDAPTGTTVFGARAVTGNLMVAGTLAPGAAATPGSIGTFKVTGDLDLTDSNVELDISSSSTSSDLIDVDGTLTVTDATLTPNFIGGQFKLGDNFKVFESTTPIVGGFENQSDTFALPNQPFLQAITDASVSGEFTFLIQDNGMNFTDVVSGSNQTAAAALLDRVRADTPTPSPSIEAKNAADALRNGTTDQAVMAIDQLSGSIYPSLIGAEIHHIQNNVESVRDRIAMQFGFDSDTLERAPWARVYGVTGEVDADEYETLGYRHRIGGMELGAGVAGNNGLSAHTFAHLATANLDIHGVDQHADIDSYRMGGAVEYVGPRFYVLGAAGAGIQNYEVRRSLSALTDSPFAESSFDGSAQYGYVELGTLVPGLAMLWTPYVALHSTRVELDSIRETGDTTFALINEGGAGDSLRSALGLSLAQSGLTPLGIATTRIRFGWMHEYLDESEAFVSAIANDGTPTESLTDRGVQAGSDFGFARVQVDMGHLFGGQFSVAYVGQANRDSFYNSLLAGIRWIL